MEIIPIIFICILGLGLLMNFFTHLGLIWQISRYCYQTGTLDHYWTLFFKNGFVAKAIISSVIATVIALAVFLVLVPVVLLRRASVKKKQRADPAYFNEDEFLKG